MMTTLRGMALVGASCAALAGCSVGFSPKHKDQRLVTMTHDATSALRVESVNGSVYVGQGEPGHVRVEATLRGPDLDRLLDTEIVTERRDGGVFVGVDWSGGKRGRNEGCDFVIEIPSATLIVVRTSNDEVIVDHIGESVDIATSNDEVEVRGVRGDIRIATSNDHVIVRGAAGEVDIKTSNDDVSISLAPEGVGPVRVATSNDDIELRVGRAFGGVLEASTSNGRVRVYGDGVESGGHGKRTRATLRFDLAGGESRLSTSNSDITVLVEG